jgi:hypothetical protein
LAGATYRQDLPESGLLSGIQMQIYGTPVNDARIAIDTWRIIDFLNELRIVGNGAEVLFKLNGRMAQYLNWMQGGLSMPDQHHNYGTSTLRCHLFIPFGRYPFDADFGLDLSGWDNVELQFTNEATAALFASGFSIDTKLVLLRDAGARQFLGHIRNEEYRKWTTVAGETKYIDLPTERMLRHMLFQVDADVDSNYVAEATLYNVLNNLKVTLRDGLEEVYNSNIRDLWQLNSMWDWRGNPITGGETYHTDAYGFRTGLGQTFYKAGAYLSHDGGQSAYAPDYVPGDDSMTQTRQCDGDGDQWSGLFAGVSYENVVRVDFDVSPDPSSWLDLAAKKTVKVEAYTGNSSSYADGSIVLALARLFPNRV